MAKKTFKGGLDSLIESSLGLKKKDPPKTKKEKDELAKALKNLEDVIPQEDDDVVDIDDAAADDINDEQYNIENDKSDFATDIKLNEDYSALKMTVADLKQELFLWRTGQITPDSFAASLDKFGLFFDKDTNEIVSKD